MNQKKLFPLSLSALTLMLLNLFLAPDVVLCKGVDDHVAIELVSNKCCTGGEDSPVYFGGRESLSRMDVCSDTPVEVLFVSNRQSNNNCQKLDFTFLIAHHDSLWRRYLVFDLIFSAIQSHRPTFIIPLQGLIKSTVLLI